MHVAHDRDVLSDSYIVNSTHYATESYYESLAQLAMGVDVQPRHPGSNPRGCEFGFLLLIKKNSLWGYPPPLSFQKKSYYERGKHGLMNLNNIEFPLFLLEFLKLYLLCLPMLFALRFYNLSLYKTIFHRKWFRFKCVLYLLFNALYCFKLFCGAFALSSSLAPT
jgi:hypothetical protein